MRTFFDAKTLQTDSVRVPTREEENRENPVKPKRRGRPPSRQGTPQTTAGETTKDETNDSMAPKETHLKIENDEGARETAEDREEDGELTVDIYDKGDAIIIQSTVAGVKPEDLDISITTDSITIRGKRKQQDEVRDEDYYYKELFWGAFSRSIILPEEIDETAAEANVKHGLLTIRLPKKKKNIVQKLKVKVS